MNSWNNFMQTKQARIAMYGICVAFSVFYAIDAVMELMDPVRSAQYIETLGTTTFYLMDGGRALVCAITAIAFARILHKTMNEPDK